MFKSTNILGSGRNCNKMQGGGGFTKLCNLHNEYKIGLIFKSKVLFNDKLALLHELLFILVFHSGALNRGILLQY